jgi:membrane-bound serine protease (ClpP class)
MAAHLAAMTPGTNIGAAHPIQIGAPTLPKEKGAQDAVMESKVTNDLSAYLQAIASRRGRNKDWASLVVVKSTSVTSGDAVRLGVVDLEAQTLADLLRAADGWKLADFPSSPLRTRGALLERFEMSHRQRLLAAVSDPNIAMILMTLGVSGLLIELYSPGLILPGIVGAASLILAFYSFHTLSASYAGILLILMGFLLYILELKFTSFGLLALSGTAAVFFGALMLFRGSGGGLRISMGVLTGTVGTMAAVFAALFYIASQALARRSRVGLEGLVGAKGRAVSPLDCHGTVSLQGELWRAESVEGSIPSGAEIIVVSAEGLALKVRRKP